MERLLGQSTEDGEVSAGYSVDLPANQRRERGSQGRKAPDPEGVDGRERGASIQRVGALIAQC